MKTETILRDLETVKERLAAEAGDDSRRFLDQMDAWLEQHPHAGAMINSPEELQARLRSRGTSEPVPPPAPPYRVHNPIIAGIHRIRDSISHAKMADPLIMKDEPPKKKL